jgi:hypothetical protein
LPDQQGFINSPKLLGFLRKKVMSNTLLPKPAQTLSDVKVDMFSTQGFALANRVATAFSTSDAVPAAFRAFTVKKAGSRENIIENPAAIGNCLVAIEVAQTVGMSVTAVMQNADVIEGKLRWSDKFVVAGVNASRRFTPLRFEVTDTGEFTAAYKEKVGWDEAKNRPIFEDRSVTLQNYQSVAWALPHGFVMPAGIYTLAQAKAANLPVIEGPPVSMKLAVEEGWYAKSGSKWQTELKHKMLMMRAGRYFGDIYAPDVSMGIGRTSDEELDDFIDMEPIARAESGSVERYVMSPIQQSAAPTPESEQKPIVQPEQGKVQEQKPAVQPEQAMAIADEPKKQETQQTPAITQSDAPRVSDGQIKWLETKAAARGVSLATLFESAKCTYTSNDAITIDQFDAVKLWVVENA